MMIKCEATETFTLSKFNELKNIVRKCDNTEGKLYKGDVFECDRKLADYLLGNNTYNKGFIKILEIIPDKKVKKEK